MSDHVMRGLRVQLTTTMDSVLRTALFEIIKVFENALHDHKLEVAQKGEEIAQLKIKLQTAEIKLKDLESGRSSKAEKKLTHRKPDAPGRSSTLPPDIPDAPRRSSTLPPDVPDAPRRSSTLPPDVPDAPRRSFTLPPDVPRRSSTLPPDVPRRSSTLPPDVQRRSSTLPPDVPRRSSTLPPDVPDAPRRSSTHPETDFEVPDDWCAPLGYETAKKRKTCPSVTLRQLSIPLTQVPINKEKLNCPSSNLQRCKGNRRSRRISSLKDKSKPSVIKEVPYYVQGVNISSVRSDNTILLRDVKHEDCALTNSKCLRKQNMAENTLTDKWKEKTSKHQKTLKKLAKKGTTSAELTNAKIKRTKKYTCMFCSKLFKTKSGRNVHARFHRTCTGCKKVLGGVYSLNIHTQSCAAYKKRMTQEAKKPPSICDRSSNTTVKSKVNIKNEGVEVSINNSKTFNKHTSSHKVHANVIDKN